MANWNDRTVAVIGSGHQGMAAIINVLLDIAVQHPSSASPVDLLIVNTYRPQPEGEAPYPMNGIDVDDLHPFETPRPPADFWTFGEYVREMSQEDPRLVGAREAPTYGQITEYLQFMMELAIVAAGGKVEMRRNEKSIDRIETNTAGGTAAILYNDGTILTVSPVYAKQPPHMGGVEQRP